VESRPEPKREGLEVHDRPDLVEVPCKERDLYLMKVAAEDAPGLWKIGRGTDPQERAKERDAEIVRTHKRAWKHEVVVIFRDAGEMECLLHAEFSTVRYSEKGFREYFLGDETFPALFRDAVQRLVSVQLERQFQKRRRAEVVLEDADLKRRRAVLDLRRMEVEIFKDETHAGQERSDMIAESKRKEAEALLLVARAESEATLIRARADADAARIRSVADLPEEAPPSEAPPSEAADPKDAAAWAERNLRPAKDRTEAVKFAEVKRVFGERAAIGPREACERLRAAGLESVCASVNGHTMHLAARDRVALAWSAAP
jgi:T5orf172 domain